MDNNQNQEELFIPKTKHKFLKILLASLIVIGMAIGGYFIYQSKFNNPNKTVTKLLEDANTNVDKAFETSSQSGKYKVNGLVKVDGSLPDEMKGIMDLIKQLSLQFNGEIDLDSKNGLLDLNTKYKDDKLINIKTVFENNDTYIYLEDIFDKYIKLSNETVTEELPTVEVDVNASKTLVKSLINAFNKELDNHELMKEEATISIDGKDTNVYNNYLVLSDKELNTFAKGIINNLQNDSNFIEAYKKVTNNDAQEYLKKALEEMNDDFKGTYKISFYTTKGLLKQELVRFSQEITQEEQKTILNVDKINDNEMIISANSSGMEVSIKVKKNNTAVGLNLNLNMMGMVIKLDADVNYEKINEISKVDTSNYVKMDELTEKDASKIDENLGKNQNIVKFIEEIQKLLTQNEV